MTDSIRYVGVNDHDVDLFEGQYVVPNGMAYNSYVILDEKVAILDTVDHRKCTEYLENLEAALAGRKPDYLVIHHIEPDHASSVQAVVERWPEVMMSYESTEKVLFSADAFGKFGALDAQEDWDCEARRYYFNIVGKYGTQVQTVLKKAAGLDIETICPLHGPILTETIPHVLDLYQTWSGYGVESEGVFIAYASLHGNTAAAAEKLADLLRQKGCPKVTVADLARCDMAEALEDAFRYGKIVLAASTYNAGIMPFMEDFLHHLKAKNYQKRTVGLMENGSWAPFAVKGMTDILSTMKEITILPETVTLRGPMKESDLPAMEALASALV